MLDPEENFGAMLKRAAGTRSMTLTELARTTGVHLGNLSQIANNKRVCGLSLAVRLADALGLWSSNRMVFLQAASKTTTRKERPLDHAHFGYPAELRDLVVNSLAAEKIYPEDIVRITTGPDGATPIVELRSGRSVKVSVNLQNG
jgi:plasmid maintenance system antidote protein VapI